MDITTSIFLCNYFIVSYRKREIFIIIGQLLTEVQIYQVEITLGIHSGVNHLFYFSLFIIFRSIIRMAEKVDKSLK